MDPEKAERESSRVAMYKAGVTRPKVTLNTYRDWTLLVRVAPGSSLDLHAPCEVTVTLPAKEIEKAMAQPYGKRILVGRFE